MLSAWRRSVRRGVLHHVILSPSSSRLRPMCSQSQLGLQYGELLLTVDKNEKKRLFELKEGDCIHSHKGMIKHTDIIGNQSGTTFTTHNGAKLLIRRPTLEEYVLIMKRGPTPSYAKDIWAIIGMLNIGPGSTVLEAGTGSGALTLYLSSAVGEDGRILSFERRESHLHVAKNNYQRWINSRKQIQGSKSWPDNVTFHQEDLIKATELLACGSIDAVCLDVQSPIDIMCSVESLLKPCGALVVYLPNISQVIELDYHIRRRNLLFHLEHVVEVTHKLWTVHPASGKHLPLAQFGNDEVQRLGNSAAGIVNNLTPYLTRPSHWQPPHTGFLMKLYRALEETD